MRLLIALILLCFAPAARAQTDASVVLAQVPLAEPAAFDGASWGQDLDLIARELPARHPDLFFRMSRASWDSAVGALDSRLPAMTRNQAMVAFMELVGLVSDGHTLVIPLFDPAVGVRYYPLQLHAFDDGLYVRWASPEHAALAGAKVLRIGRASAEEAMAAAARTVPHENEGWARAWAPGRLFIAEILDGLGLVDDMENLPIVVEIGGRRDSVVVGPAGRFVPSGHNPNTGIDLSGWAEMRDAGSAPLWLRNPDRPYWVEFVGADGTLYVSYRGVVDAEPRNAEFWRQVFAMADSLPVERLVIDVRENMGGNSFFNRQVIRGILARPALDDPERLFVVIGPRTFSAAMNLVTDLDHWTNATFVGEPTGNALMFFGDHAQIALPASGLTVNVSTLPWHPYDPRDTRDFLPPDVYTPLTAADYRANVDPAMRAILARAATPSLDERVESAVAAGDSAAAARLVEAAAADPANRFRSPEADVNALGYRLLRSGNAPAAIQVFRINADAFPSSANVWDSLGEALLAANRRDEAIAAYRKALELEPEFGSAREALERLGASPGTHP